MHDALKSYQNPNRATHKDYEGRLYVVSLPGQEDGTIEVWEDGSWWTAETSSEFEKTLIPLNGKEH